MKTVFTSKEAVAKLWATQSQETARQTGDRFYFHGKTIYSYGGHFPIATIVNGGLLVVIFRCVGLYGSRGRGLLRCGLC